MIEDYDALQGPSLLKKNLGLQQFQFSRYNGSSSSWAPFLLDYCEFNDRDEHPLPSRSSIRRVSADTSFLLKKYSGTQVRADEIDLLDQIERVVAPHGPNLVSLYFRIVHPSFPMLDKKYASCSRARFRATRVADNGIAGSSWRNTNAHTASFRRPVSGGSIS